MALKSNRLDMPVACDCLAGFKSTYLQKNANFVRCFFSFGQAAMFLNEEEYGWLAKLAKTPCCTKGGSCKYVFHTVAGMQIVKASNFLLEAWKDAGRKGDVNFNQIRSKKALHIINSSLFRAVIKS